MISYKFGDLRSAITNLHMIDLVRICRLKYTYSKEEYLEVWLPYIEQTLLPKINEDFYRISLESLKDFLPLPIYKITTFVISEDYKYNVYSEEFYDLDERSDLYSFLCVNNLFHPPIKNICDNFKNLKYLVLSNHLSDTEDIYKEHAEKNNLIFIRDY